MLKKSILTAIIIVVCLSCKKSNNLTQSGLNRQNVIAKIKSGKSIKIACEGTSLTYGEDIKGTDTVSAALPNGPVRAKYQYPATMLQALNNPNITLSMRGYPGDRTTEGLERWKDSTTTDICIIEYGTNDAYNFATLAGGAVPVNTYQAQLKQLIERRLNQGAWVILCLSPMLQSKSTTIIAYRNAAIKVALELGVNAFDIEQSIKSIPSPYSDLVHFNSTGYQKWGLDMAKLLAVAGNE